MLERLQEQRGLPSQIRVDNGPKLISAELYDRCEAHEIKLAHITPGKPQPNGFVERFNGSFHREILDAYLFENLTQVRDMALFWMIDYNEEQPRESLGDLPPMMYRHKVENSSLELCN